MARALRLSQRQLLAQCRGDPLLLAIARQDSVAFAVMHEQDAAHQSHSPSPLHVACSIDSDEFVRSILQHARDGEALAYQRSIEANRAEKANILSDVLERRGINVKRLVTAIEDWYRLEEAILFRRTQFRIEHKVMSLLASVDENRQTPLHYCCRATHTNKRLLTSLLLTYRGDFSSPHFSASSVYDMSSGVEIIQSNPTLASALPSPDAAALGQVGLGRRVAVDVDVVLPWLLGNIHRRCAASTEVLLERARRVSGASAHPLVLLPCELRELLYGLSVVVTDELLLELCRRYSADSEAVLSKLGERSIRAEGKSAGRRRGAKDEGKRDESESDEDEGKRERVSASTRFAPRAGDDEFALSVELLAADLVSGNGFKAVTLSGRAPASEGEVGEVGEEEGASLLALVRAGGTLATVGAIRRSRRSLVRFEDAFGRSALLYASANGHAAYVSVLVAEGALLLSSAGTGQSALSVASTGTVRAELDRALIACMTRGTPIAHADSRSRDEGSVPSGGAKDVPSAPSPLRQGSLALHLGKLREHRWEYSRGALSWAAASGLSSTVKELLAGDRGAALDRDALGRGALHVLCAELRHGCAGLVDALLQAGAQADAASVCGRTALHALFLPPARVTSPVVRREVLRALLDWGATPGLRDQAGLSAVHYCARRDYVDCMRILVSYGCDLRAPTHCGSSALHLACRAKAVRTVQYMCALDVDSYSGLTSVLDAKGRPPLRLLPAALASGTDNAWMACLAGDVARLQTIVAELHHGQEDAASEDKAKDDEPRAGPGSIDDADDEHSPHRVLSDSPEDMYSDGINSKTKRMRWSCLHACIAGLAKNTRAKSSAIPDERYLSILQFLLESGAYVDSLDIHCRSPVMYAVMTRSTTCMQILMDAGADLDMRDLDNNSVTHLAYMYKSYACLRLLRSADRTDEEATNLAGKTPLEMAGKGKPLQQTIFCCNPG